MKQFLTLIFLASCLISNSQSFVDSPILTHYLHNSIQKGHVNYTPGMPYDGIGRNLLNNNLSTSFAKKYGTGYVPRGIYNALFGNLNAGLSVPNRKLKLEYQGSQQGENFGQISSRFYKRIKGTTISTETIIDGYSYQKKLDENEDGFRDLPERERLMIGHKTTFSSKKLEVGLSAFYMNSESTSGDVNFDKTRDYLKDSIYGYGYDFEHFGGALDIFIPVSLKNKNNNGNFYIKVDGTAHQQSNFYGVKQLIGEETLTNITAGYFQKNLLSKFELSATRRDHSIIQTYFKNTKNINIERYSLFGHYSTFWGKSNRINLAGRVDYENEKLDFYPRVQLDMLLGLKKNQGYYSGSSNASYLSFFAGREKRLSLPLIDNQQYFNSTRFFLIDTPLEIYDKGWIMGSSLTLEELEIELPWIFDYEYAYVQNTKILWRTLALTEQTRMNLPALNSNEIGSFDRDTELDFQYLFEFTTTFRFQRFYTTFLMRANFPNETTLFLPMNSLMTSFRYNFNFGLSTNLTWYHIAKQNLPDGTKSGRINRWDWRNTINLEQVWSNWFTQKSTFHFGMNNISGKRKGNTYIGKNDPFSGSFDGMSVWGNTVGFQLYGGFSIAL